MKKLDAAIREYRKRKALLSDQRKAVDLLFWSILDDVEKCPGKVNYYLIALPEHSEWIPRLRKRKQEFDDYDAYKERVKRREEEEESQGYYDE